MGCQRISKAREKHKAGGRSEIVVFTGSPLSIVWRNCPTPPVIPAKERVRKSRSIGQAEARPSRLASLAPQDEEVCVCPEPRCGDFRGAKPLPHPEVLARSASLEGRTDSDPAHSFTASKAGIHCADVAMSPTEQWISAFAGMTRGGTARPNDNWPRFLHALFRGMTKEGLARAKRANPSSTPSAEPPPPAGRTPCRCPASAE